MKFAYSCLLKHLCHKYFKVHCPCHPGDKIQTLDTVHFIAAYTCQGVEIMTSVDAWCLILHLSFPNSQ